MNKSRILALIAGAAIMLVVVIGGIWFWSIGSVAAEKLPAIRVEALKGAVEVKQGDVWTTVKDVQEIAAGDTVRTSEGAEAQILWGDQGVTRLDSGTEVVVDAAPADGAGAGSSVIKLKVNAGRIWNRMLKLLDVDSAMEVQTSDVVATVRGTSYGIIKRPNCTEAAVTESAVGIRGMSTQEEVLLTDDQWGSFGANDCKQPVRKLTPEDAWPAEQQVKDVAFDRDYMGSFRERLDQRAPQAPAWAVNASERLRLALASGEEREALALGYAKRRLAEAVRNPSVAKSNLSEIRRLLPEMGKKSGVLRGELHVASALLSRSRFPALQNEGSRLALPSALADDATLNDLRLIRDAVIGSSETDIRFRELVRIDEGVDDLLEGVFPAEGRTRTVADLMTRLDAADAAIGEAGDDRLKAKSKAIRARLETALGLPELTPPTIEPSPEDKPPIRINEPTLRNPVIKAPTQPNQSTRIYQTLTLLASPSAPVGGQTVTLKLFGTKSDGMSDELTSKAVFSLSRSSDGTIQGNSLTPVFIGNIVVNATFVDAQGTRTASATVTHSAPKAPTGLQSIEIRFTGPTTVTCSTSVPYKIYAVYGDKTTRDVTISAKMTVSDPKLLYPGDQKILTFCSGVQATGTVTASYTEGGVAKTAQASITVVPDASTPSAPRYPYRIY